nr:dermokine [Kogia breviceps]
MKLQGSLACLLLVLCLGGGEAGPLLGGGESAGGGAMEATGHRVGEAIKHGVGEATGGGDGEAAGSAVKEAPGPGLGDAVARGVEEAAHALGNTGSEAGTQAENVIQHGVDAVHSSRQATPGDSGALGTSGQPPSGGHGTSGSPGSPGGPGIPWDHVYSEGSGGSLGTNSQGGSWGHGGHGGAFNPGTNTQGSSGNGSSSGGSSGGSSGPHGVSSPLLKAEVGPLVVPAEETQSEVSRKAASPRLGGVPGVVLLGSLSFCSPPSQPHQEVLLTQNSRNFDPGGYSRGQGSSGGGEAVNGTNTLVLPRAHSVGSYSHPISRRSSGLFNFDTFWKNLKSMLGFSNWDAINKGRVPDPRTGILLCFRQLWENFIRNIPFLNWKAIFKNYDYNQQIHPTATGGQHSATIPTKEGVTISSSASRARPDLLQWVQFW